MGVEWLALFACLQLPSSVHIQKKRSVCVRVWGNIQRWSPNVEHRNTIIQPSECGPYCPLPRTNVLLLCILEHGPLCFCYYSFLSRILC
jgi:hypothetical protein